MDETSYPGADPDPRERIGAVLRRIPQGLYLLTAADGYRRSAVLVSWVQQASFEPPMALVSLLKGRGIVPVIHEARAFALNQIAEDDKMVLRKFSRSGEAEDEETDLLEGFGVTRHATGAPVLTRALCFMDCELVRHIDTDGDHDIYVGLIRDAGVLREGEAPIHTREDGFQY